MIDYALKSLGAPAALGENAELLAFCCLLTYALLVINWIVTTDWEAKFHWFSLSVCALGLFYLHYSDATLVEQYENVFITVWLILLWYHSSTWKNNYSHMV